ERVKLALITKVDEIINQSHLDYVSSVGNCTVGIYKTNISKEFVEKFHEKGLPIISWTVNDEPTQRQLIELGVDMIVTNAIINPQRNKKIISTTITTEDNGLTWEIDSFNMRGKVRDNANISIEDGSVVLEFEGHLKQAIANLKQIVKSNDITVRKSRIMYIISYHDSTGKVFLNIFDNGNFVNTGVYQAAYNNFYFEVVF